LDDSEWLFARGCKNLIVVETNIGFSTPIEHLLRKALSPYKRD